jgi:hypothetical protein
LDKKYAVQAFGTARPGDFYDAHLWKELLRFYAVYSNSHCDDPVIAKEARKRHQLVLAASEGRLPYEAFIFDIPLPPEQREEVLAEINAALCGIKGKWSQPLTLDHPIGFPSRTLRKAIDLKISSAFIADLQNWATANISRFRPRAAGKP